MLSLNNVRWATKALRIFTKSFPVDHLLFEFHVLSLSVHAVRKCHEMLHIYIHTDQRRKLHHERARRRRPNVQSYISCWTCQWTRRRVSWNRTARDKGKAIAVMWLLCNFHGVTLFPLILMQEIASLSTMPNPESSFVACAYQMLGHFTNPFPRPKSTHVWIYVYMCVWIYVTVIMINDILWYT